MRVFVFLSKWERVILLFGQYVDFHCHDAFIEAVFAPEGPEVEEEKVYGPPEDNPEGDHKAIAEDCVEIWRPDRDSLQIGREGGADHQEEDAEQQRDKGLTPQGDHCIPVLLKLELAVSAHGLPGFPDEIRLDACLRQEDRRPCPRFSPP